MFDFHEFRFFYSLFFTTIYTPYIKIEQSPWVFTFATHHVRIFEVLVLLGRAACVSFDTWISFFESCFKAESGAEKRGLLLWNSSPHHFGILIGNAAE